MNTPWKTIGEKALPGGTLLRLQLNGITKLRRVQRQVCLNWWLTLPEPLALREALVWNWHLRPTIDREGAIVERSVFMHLPEDVELLPLTHSWCDRWIVSLYHQVGPEGWWDGDEEYGTWRALEVFFKGRK